MANVHFSRRARMFVVHDMDTEDGFDAYPVEMPERTLTRVKGIKDVIDRVYESFESNPAPEECAQAEADLLTELLDELFTEDNDALVEEALEEVLNEIEELDDDGYGGTL